MIILHPIELILLSATNRHKHYSLALLYKILKTNEASYLKDKRYSQLRPDLRPSSREFKVPTAQFGNYEKSFFIYIIRKWNILPFV